MYRIYRKLDGSVEIQKSFCLLWLTVDAFAMQEKFHEKLVEIHGEYYDEFGGFAKDRMGIYDAERLIEAAAGSGKIVRKDGLAFRLREFFRGHPGMDGATGMQGMRGAKGEAGPPGKILRGPTDVQCPHCMKFRMDEPAQMFEMTPRGRVGLGDDFMSFEYLCNSCEKTSLWAAHAGILFPITGSTFPDYPSSREVIA